MESYYFLLGASDIEMSEIVSVLTGDRMEFCFATEAGGQRVSPRSAYSAERVEIPKGSTPVFVECRFADMTGINRFIVVDHHREGDPGYGLPPEKYLEGSSLGQVLKLLGIEANERQKLIAAGDHCPSHAYRGSCPGVAPADMLRLRMEEKVAWRATNPRESGSRDLEAALSDVLGTVEKLKTVNTVVIDGHSFVDIRNIDEAALPELPEASAYAGVPVMYRRPDPRSGGIKVGVLNGEPAALTAWMRWAGENPELKEVYGDPARGYAGAYEV